MLELLGLHTQIQLQRNLGNEISTERAFEVYRSIYAIEVDKESFDKSFLTVTGYTIDDNGHAKSLSRLVRDFSSQFEKDTNNTVLYEIYYMNYLESQLLSHANGYLWFANQGAWNDIHGLINGSNNGLSLLLNGILEIVKDKVSDQNRK